MIESKRPRVSKWVVGILKEADSPLTRKAIVQQLSSQGRDVTSTQLGTALSNMRHRKQLVVTGKKLKRFSMSEVAVARWNNVKKDKPVQFNFKQVEMQDVVEPVIKAKVIKEVKMGDQESLMLVYMRVKIAAMVLCTGAFAVLAGVLAIRLYS